MAGALKSWVRAANEPGCDFRSKTYLTAGSMAESKVWLSATPFWRSPSTIATSHSLVTRGFCRAAVPASRLGLEFELPVDIDNYTDFYASIHHATNVGRRFRPDNPLLPNYKHVPIAYNGQRHQWKSVEPLSAARMVSWRRAASGQHRSSTMRWSLAS